MMRGKSPPSELLEIIKSNNSLRFIKEFSKGDNFYLCQNIILFDFFMFILIKRAKLIQISLFNSITLKFAILTHHCNLCYTHILTNLGITVPTKINVFAWIDLSDNY